MALNFGQSADDAAALLGSEAGSADVFGSMGGGFACAGDHTRILRKLAILARRPGRQRPTSPKPINITSINPETFISACQRFLYHVGLIPPNGGAAPRSSREPQFPASLPDIRDPGSDLIMQAPRWRPPDMPGDTQHPRSNR